MTVTAHPHTVGGQVADYFHSARTAAALLALSDATLARIGVTRAQIRALADRLVG